MRVCSPKLSLTDATSASCTVRPPLSWIWVCERAKASSALPSTRTDWRDPAISLRPPAALMFNWRSARLT
jgi:hypothetical protein